MSSTEDLERFIKDHPHPDAVGLKSLFRFGRATQPLEYLSMLFVDGKLYHALPSQFNDPFEAKPQLRWPDKGKDVRKIRKYLTKVARLAGQSRREAESSIARAFARPGFMRKSIFRAVRHTLGEARICSFTSSKRNLLFWAHYAESHRGFCVEYDATVLPISYAFKLKYTKEYPTVSYPAPADARNFLPLLIKSMEWRNEEEFRTIFVPEANRQPKNDGTSLVLSGNEIRHVYFGALMKASHKDLILGLLRKGPFRPGIWQAKLSESQFKLEFEIIDASTG